MLDRPVAADVGEQVGRAGQGAIEAGHVEHGLAVAHGGGGDGGVLPVQGVERGVQAGLVADR
ncbi:MAG TPA: hypothetical protein VMU94_06925 [Streptosporangiaceae bacterium]|nr:hypothetical protein [Streptosporangiaceae bacterium]